MAGYMLKSLCLVDCRMGPIDLDTTLKVLTGGQCIEPPGSVVD